MKRVFLSILLSASIGPTVAADAQDDRTIRENLRSLSPVALIVIEDFEKKQGRQFTAEELQEFVMTDTFVEQLKKEQARSAPKAFE